MAAKRKAKEKKPLSPRGREVLDEAARLFCEQGYGGTSMDDVAAAVELTKGTLYHHFPGKADILSQIYDEAADIVLAGTKEIPGELSPPEALRSLVAGIMQLIEDRRHLVTIFHQEMPWVEQWLPPADARRIRGKMREYIDYVEGVLQRGIDSGDFRDIDVPPTAYALIGMVTWSYRWWDPMGQRDAGEVTDLLAGIFLRGISPA